MVTHNIVVLIPFRNVGNYIIDCINSVHGQIYEKYKVFLLDDNSDDGTLDHLQELDENVAIRRNNNRLGPMENIYSALVDFAFEDEDIIVLLDGDDFIACEYAFQILNDCYNSDIFLTYGQYIDSYGRIGHCSPYTEDEYANLRLSPWKASHLKTFKYKLFRELISQDINVKNFRFDNGQFYMASSDMGIMIPLMEIAGFRRIKFIGNILYYYRLHNGNDHISAQGRKLQLDAESAIRNRKSFLRPIKNSI